MSVGKNSFSLAPYYEWRTQEGYKLGLSATEYICGAAGTSIAVVAGNVQTPTTTTRIMQYTENGISWSSITAAPNTSIISMAYGNGVFVAVGAAGVIYSAQESAIQTWTARTKAGTSANDFARVQFISDTGYFYAWQQTSSERVQYSSNGTTWTLIAATFNAAIPVPSPAVAGSDQTGIAYVNGMHILFTGATSTVSSDRYFTFTNISSSTYTATSGTSWAGFPTDAGNGEWYASNIASLATRIGWGSQSAIGSPTDAPANSDFNTRNFIPIVESNISSVSNGYFTFYNADQNPIEVYRTDGYYQVIGAVVYSAPNWSGVQYGIGHYLYPENDNHGLRREFISGSRVDNVSLSRSVTRYRIRFAFKGSQYLILGKNANAAVLGGAHRNYVIKGSRAFRPVRTTTDYRF